MPLWHASALVALLEGFRPTGAVVEIHPPGPWPHDLLTGRGFSFVLARAERLRIITESNDKHDEIDAEISWREE